MNMDTHVPKRLYSLQKWMGRVISLPMQKTDELGLPLLDKSLAKEALVHMKDGPLLSADKRVAIYNQQYWFRLFSIMHDIFPFVLRLFGYKEFNKKIAEPYLLSYPPNHWSLNELGKNLPKWIEKNYQNKDKKLIYEAALVDEAYDRLFYAGHLPYIKKMQKDKKLYLQTTLALFSLSSNLFSLRQQFLGKNVDYWMKNAFPSIFWGKTKHFVLHRYKEKIIYHEIDRGQYLLLKAFEKGATLTEAIGQIMDIIDPTNIEEKMKKWFFQWVKQGYLSFG